MRLPYMIIRDNLHQPISLIEDEKNIRRIILYRGKKKRVFKIFFAKEMKFLMISGGK